MRFRLLEDYKNDYLARTTRHIARVIKYGNKLGKDYRNHDEDKLNELFDGYSLMMKKDKFGGSDIKDNMSGLTKDEEDKVNYATWKHITSNDHHPEYWAEEEIKTFDRANPQLGLHCERMPYENIDEMLCDWCAMSEEFNNTPQEWLAKVVPERWIFNKEQIEYMKDKLDFLWNNKLNEDGRSIYK